MQQTKTKTASSPNDVSRCFSLISDLKGKMTSKFSSFLGLVIEQTFPELILRRLSVSARLGLGRLHRAGESVRVFFFNMVLSKWYVWVIYVKLIHPGYLASAFMHILW